MCNIFGEKTCVASYRENEQDARSFSTRLLVYLFYIVFCYREPVHEEA